MHLFFGGWKFPSNYFQHGFIVIKKHTIKFEYIMIKETPYQQNFKREPFTRTTNKKIVYWLVALIVAKTRINTHEWRNILSNCNAHKSFLTSPISNTAIKYTKIYHGLSYTSIPTWHDDSWASNLISLNTTQHSLTLPHRSKY